MVFNEKGRWLIEEKFCFLIIFFLFKKMLFEILSFFFFIVYVFDINYFINNFNSLVNIM